MLFSCNIVDIVMVLFVLNISINIQLLYMRTFYGVFVTHSSDINSQTVLKLFDVYYSHR